MKLRDASLQVYEKNSFTYPPSCILPSFSRNACLHFLEMHHDYFFQRGLLL